MNKIEFETIVRHDTIHIPAVYRNYVHGRVRVIIVTEQQESEGDMIEYLFTHPYHTDTFTPLTREQIYDRT